MHARVTLQTSISTTYGYLVTRGQSEALQRRRGILMCAISRASSGLSKPGWRTLLLSWIWMAPLMFLSTLKGVALSKNAGSWLHICPNQYLIFIQLDLNVSIKCQLIHTFVGCAPNTKSLRNFSDVMSKLQWCNVAGRVPLENSDRQRKQFGACSHQIAVLQHGHPTLARVCRTRDYLCAVFYDNPIPAFQVHQLKSNTQLFSLDINSSDPNSTIFQCFGSTNQHLNVSPEPSAFDIYFCDDRFDEYRLPERTCHAATGRKRHYARCLDGEDDVSDLHAFAMKLILILFKLV